MCTNIDLKIKEIIIKLSKGSLNIDEIKEESNIVSDFQFDSLGCIQLITTIEERFDFVFNVNELELDKIIIYGNLKKVVIDNLNEQFSKK